MVSSYKISSGLTTGRIVITQDVNDSLRKLFNGAKTLGQNGIQETKADKPERTHDKDEQDGLKSRAKLSGFKSSFRPIAAVSADGAELDGEPMDEDLDGEAIDEDIDGEAMDEDLDGEAMS